MINKKNYVFVTLRLWLLLLGITGHSASAQQRGFNYAQYMDNLSPFNPAYSLLDKAGSINALVRRQWVGVDGAPASYLINGHLPIESINSAAGLIIFNDQVAIERQTEINAYFAKEVQLSSTDYLALSINAGLRNYSANYSMLDGVDPTFRNDVRETKPNIGFGVIYHTDWYYLGVSAPELSITSLGTASVQNSSNFKSRYYFSGALLADINEDVKFKPATLLCYAKAVPLTADVSGTFYLKETLGLGFNYRTDKTMAGLLSINMNAFHVGYCYQFGTSSANLGSFNNATHEIMIGMRFLNTPGVRTKLL